MELHRETKKMRMLLIYCFYVLGSIPITSVVSLVVLGKLFSGGVVMFIGFGERTPMPPIVAECLASVNDDSSVIHCAALHSGFLQNLSPD